MVSRWGNQAPDGPFCLPKETPQMRITQSAVIVAGCFLTTTASIADDSKAPPLGGPPVAKDADTGKDGFGMDGGPKGRERPMQAMLAERRNGELWRRAFEEVMPTLSQEVQAEVRAIRADFEQRQRAWREANGSKLKELEEKARARREAMQDGGDGDAKPAAPAKPDPAVVEEMQRLRASAPKAEETQAKVWALLTPEQQSTFKARYDALQAEAQKRRGQRSKGPGQAKEPGPMDADPMLPGGGKPGKRPGPGKPFNFEDAPAGGDAPKGT
jgi:hypothetical protein